MLLGFIQVGWPLPRFSISEACPVSNSDQTDAHKVRGGGAEEERERKWRAGIKKERNKVGESHFPPHYSAIPSLLTRERERERREGGRRAAAEARSIRSGSRNHVASVDRASHLSIHRSISSLLYRYCINHPHASVRGRQGTGGEPRPAATTGQPNYRVGERGSLGCERTDAEDLIWLQPAISQAQIWWCLRSPMASIR
jgi:hypothetical protein